MHIRIMLTRCLFVSTWEHERRFGGGISTQTLFWRWEAIKYDGRQWGVLRMSSIAQYPTSLSVNPERVIPQERVYGSLCTRLSFSFSKLSRWESLAKINKFVLPVRDSVRVFVVDLWGNDSTVCVCVFYTLHDRIFFALSAFLYETHTVN